jgi:ketosteroid isomerase-like protein
VNQGPLDGLTARRPGVQMKTNSEVEVRDVIREYYEAVHEHDWEKLASTLAEDVVRTGFMADFAEDTAKGKGPYLDFCRTVIESFQYHAMEIRRIFYSDDRRQACAETEETIQKPGEERFTLHCLKVHDIDEDGLITGIDQYRKASSGQVPITLSVRAVMAGLKSTGNASM